MSCENVDLGRRVEQVMYDYYGMRPPYDPNIVFLEDVFCRRDPFSSRPRPLCVGGRCSICTRSVCVARHARAAQAAARRQTALRRCGLAARLLTARRPCSTCSLFYAKRFCAVCAKANAEAFPPELQKDIEKASS